MAAMSAIAFNQGKGEGAFSSHQILMNVSLNVTSILNQNMPHMKIFRKNAPKFLTLVTTNMTYDHCLSIWQVWSLAQCIINQFLRELLIENTKYLTDETLRCIKYRVLWIITNWPNPWAHHIHVVLGCMDSCTMLQWIRIQVQMYANACTYNRLSTVLLTCTVTGHLGKRGHKNIENKAKQNSPDQKECRWIHFLQ